MKKEKGITLLALSLYIVIFSFTLGLLATLSNYIYNNLDNISSDSISSEEFNKFNVNFLKDVKANSNAVVSNGNDDVTITFGNDTSNKTVYTYKPSDKAIYKNKAKIATNIVRFTASCEADTAHNNKNVLTVSISTGKDAGNPNFNKEIKYVLKYW